MSIMKDAWAVARGTRADACIVAFHTLPVVVADNIQDALDSPAAGEIQDAKKIRDAREWHMGAGNIAGRVGPGGGSVISKKTRGVPREAAGLGRMTPQASAVPVSQ